MFRSLQSSRFKPHRYCPGGIGNWSGHLPFAADLIDALKPSVVVELGTHYGESYFGFCQAIRAQGLSCQAYAVDTWLGDSQTGLYGPEVFRDVSAYNAEHYQSFSTLLRTTFDEAVERFGDGTIDLLHLDGCHTYEAILHDFGVWLPKVKAGGVILLHDIAVREGEFGAWRFWEEASRNYPSFGFQHGCGLGVVLKGDAASIDNPFLAEILALAVDPQGIRDYYELCAERLQYAHQAAGEYSSFCQVFSPDTTGYSDERSSTYPVSAGAMTALEFSLPSPSGRLRLDPCDCASMIEISDIIVECPSRGAILWRLDPAQFQEVESAGTLIRIPDESSLILWSYGDDPQLYLPLLESLNPEEPVRVLCTLRIDRDWSALGSLWRQIEADLARARGEANAHAHRVLRLESELAMAASQAAHYKNLLDEQQRQRKDAQNRLAEAASQAAHYKNLLDEQLQQRKDAQTRLAEAASQAAHYKNLLDEQQQQRKDAQTRLAEAASPAAHYKNLLDEQHQRKDAQTRLAEAASQAAHYKNLLDEQQQQRKDAQTRLAEAASQAAHYKNLLDEQQRQWKDAQNRLAEAASQAAHYMNLLDEQQRQRKDAQNRLADTASQAAHYKNLLDQQQRQRADAETRRDQAASQVAHYKNLLDEQQHKRADAETRLAQAISQAASQTTHYKKLLEEQRIDLDSLRASYQVALSEGTALRESLSWRITAPLRYLHSGLRFRKSEKPPAV